MQLTMYFHFKLCKASRTLSPFFREKPRTKHSSSLQRQRGYTISLDDYKDFATLIRDILYVCSPPLSCSCTRLFPTNLHGGNLVGLQIFPHSSVYLQTYQLLCNSFLPRLVKNFSAPNWTSNLQVAIRSRGIRLTLHHTSVTRFLLRLAKNISASRYQTNKTLEKPGACFLSFTYNFRNCMFRRNIVRQTYSSSWTVL